MGTRSSLCLRRSRTRQGWEGSSRGNLLGLGDRSKGHRRTRTTETLLVWAQQAEAPASSSRGQSAHCARIVNSSLFSTAVVPGGEGKPSTEPSRQFRARKMQSGRQAKVEEARASLRGDPGTRPNHTSCLGFPICQVRMILEPTPQGCWGPHWE